MRTPIIISICCLIIAITATAQTEATNSIHEKGIKGIIVGTDKEPLPFVNVVLLQDSTFVAGVATDEQGRFVFEQPSSSANKIKIVMVGYEDYFAPITQSEDLGIIMLKESSIMLNEVVVKAKLPTTRLKGNTMVTSVQNTALAKMGNAYDVLSHIPMVTGINGELNVFGRGTPVIYINGRQVKNESDLQQLNSAEIRSVELIANPGAAYASNILAVIRIITIPPQGDGFGFDITDALGFWSYARNNTDINMRYRHNGFEMFGNFNLYEGKRKVTDISELTIFAPEKFVQTIYNEGVGVTHNLFGKLGFSYMITPNHSIGAYYKLGRSNTQSEGKLDTKSIMTDNPNATPLEHTLYSFDIDSKNYPSQEANLYYN